MNTSASCWGLVPIEDKQNVPDYLAENIVYVHNEKAATHEPMHWEEFQALCGNMVILTGNLK